MLILVGFRKIVLILLLVIILSITCNGDQKSYLDRINIFFKYDKMFFFGHKEKNTSIETGPIHEIENIEEISEQYFKIVQHYLSVLKNFVSVNIEYFTEYYKIIDEYNKDNSTREKNRERYQQIKDKLIVKFRNLLSESPYIIRCMYAIDSLQYIETAIQLEEGIYANTLDFTLGTVDNVYWTRYILGSKQIKYKREDNLDEQGHMKYREWFYESNLKIRIVKQIRDAEGNYCGEIYIDYYKLDEYDKLFDKDGNPKPKG